MPRGASIFAGTHNCNLLYARCVFRVYSAAVCMVLLAVLCCRCCCRNVYTVYDVFRVIYAVHVSGCTRLVCTYIIGKNNRSRTPGVLGPELAVIWCTLRRTHQCFYRNYFTRTTSRSMAATLPQIVANDNVLISNTGAKYGPTP